MARTAEFSDDQIVEAGKQLRQSGKRITGFGLRTLVGGGNPHRLLEVWEQHESEAMGDEPQELISELPMEVSEHLNEVIHAFTANFSERFTTLTREMNHRAVASSERRVKELTQAAEEKREQAKAEVADAEFAVARAEDDRDSAQSLAEKLRAELDQAKESDRQKGFELAQLKKDHQALEKSSAKAAGDADREIAGLTSKVTGLSADLDAARDVSSKLAGQLDEARNLASEQKQTIKDLQTEASDRTRDLGKLQGKVEGQEDQISDLKAQTKTLSADLKSVNSELKSALDTIRNRDSEIQKLQMKLDEALKVETEQKPNKE